MSVWIQHKFGKGLRFFISPLMVDPSSASGWRMDGWMCRKVIAVKLLRLLFGFKHD